MRHSRRISKLITMATGHEVHATRPARVDHGRVRLDRWYQRCALQDQGQYPFNPSTATSSPGPLSFFSSFSLLRYLFPIPFMRGIPNATLASLFFLKSGQYVVCRSLPYRLVAISCPSHSVIFSPAMTAIYDHRISKNNAKRLG